MKITIVFLGSLAEDATCNLDFAQSEKLQVQESRSCWRASGCFHGVQ